MSAYYGSQRLLKCRMVLQSVARKRNTQICNREFSSNRQPSFQISHYFVQFGFFLVPALAFTMYVGKFGPEDEALEQQVRERYGADIRQNKEKNKALAEFYKHAILENDDKGTDEKLEEVFHGGKGVKKRIHSVDKELYGTHEGVESRKRMEEELAKQREEKKKFRKKRKKRKKDDVVDAKPVEESTDELHDPDSSKVTVGSVLTVVAVGTVAAVAGLVSGGRRN